MCGRRHIERKQKGGFIMGGFGKCTLVPVFGTGEHPNVPSFRFFGAGEHPNVPAFRFLVPKSIHPFGNHPFANPRMWTKKKEPKPKLFGPDIFGMGGGLPREGMGAKKFGISLKTQENQTFWRDIPGNFGGISRVPKKFENRKVCVQFLSPNYTCGRNGSSLLSRSMMAPPRTPASSGIPPLHLNYTYTL